VVAYLDAALRSFGGALTHGLTDNEKTVTVEHVAHLPARRGPGATPRPSALRSAAASTWLTEAGAAGTGRVRAKMAEAVGRLSYTARPR
jgi:hypothetical protein